MKKLVATKPEYKDTDTNWLHRNLWASEYLRGQTEPFVYKEKDIGTFRFYGRTDTRPMARITLTFKNKSAEHTVYA